MSQVIHNIDKQQFYINMNTPGSDETASADPAHLDYELLNDKTVNFTHTFVPFRLRGKGLAEQLVKTGLKWAIEQGLQINTSCWYVEKYMVEHPQ